MNQFRHKMQHHFNPLHIYCRLRTMGCSNALAKKLSTFYEQYFYARVSCSLLFFWTCAAPQAKQKAS